jgi:hypothetical protein
MARCAPDHLVGHRAEDRPLDACSSVGADHDHVGSLGLGRRDDAVRNVAIEDEEGGINTGGTGSLRELAGRHRPRFALLDRPDPAESPEWPAAARVDHVHDYQSGGEPDSDIDCRIGGAGGGTGQVGGQDDGLWPVGIVTVEHWSRSRGLPRHPRGLRCE